MQSRLMKVSEEGLKKTILQVKDEKKLAGNPPMHLFTSHELKPTYLTCISSSLPMLAALMSGCYVGNGN